MIRNVVIKTKRENTVMQVRVKPSQTPAVILAAMNACLDDFKAEHPEKYAAAATDGACSYACLFTHVPQKLLDRHELDIVSSGLIWLEIE